MLGHWGTGMLGRRNDGTLGCRDAAMLGRWDTSCYVELCRSSVGPQRLQGRGFIPRPAYLSKTVNRSKSSTCSRGGGGHRGVDHRGVDHRGLATGDWTTGAVGQVCSVGQVCWVLPWTFFLLFPP